MDPVEIAAIGSLLREYLVTINFGRPHPTHFKESTDRALCQLVAQMVLGETSEIPRRTIASFQRVLRRVEDFLPVNLERPIHLEELRERTGLDNRTLEKMFRDRLGVGPVQYLRLRRLNQVYKALLRADPATTAVADIARAWGFWDVSRFRAEFKAWFGMFPVEVIRRPNARRLTAKL